MNQISLQIFLNLQVWSRVIKAFLDLFLTFLLPSFTIHSLPIQLHCPLMYTRYPAKAQFKPEPITFSYFCPEPQGLSIKLLPHWVGFYPLVLIFLLPIFFPFFVFVHIFCCLLLDCTSFKPLLLIWLAMSRRHRSLMNQTSLHIFLNPQVWSRLLTPLSEQRSKERREGGRRTIRFGNLENKVQRS